MNTMINYNRGTCTQYDAVTAALKTGADTQRGARVIALAIVLAAAQLAGVARAHETATDAVEVNVGVRDDAKPFSYVDITRESETILPGFGGYSIEVCRHVLKQLKAQPKYQHFTFNAANIRAKDRFKELGVQGKLFMLCGPDSITLERLEDYRTTQAFFLSGMTYAYLNPRSPAFPRGNYCDHVIGVVRGTTADTEGLEDIASRDLLMRFDEALDLEVFKTSGRIAESREALYMLTIAELAAAQRDLDKLDARAKQEQGLSAEQAERRSKLQREILAVEQILARTEPGSLDKAINELVRQRIGLAGKITDLMSKQHQLINEQVARDIVTDECPQGFTSMPVRKYEGHDQGIEAFCRGEVLYYLADYDILKNKTLEISNCDIVMNRFTRSREVYGVYFPKDDQFDIDPDPNIESLIDVAGFYADFNNALLMAMQGEESEVEKIFIKEFGVQQKSEELSRFFDGFKINSR